MAVKHGEPFDPRLFLAQADGGRSIHRYGKGEAIFSQGEPSDAVFYIQRGKVKVAVISEQGKEAAVALRERANSWAGMPERAAEAVGYGARADRMRDHAGGEGRDAAGAAGRAGIFTVLYLAHSDKERPVEEGLVDQLFNSTEKRLARLLLLLLANFGKEGRPEPIVAKITQETIAEMIGTARSRVRRELVR